MSQTYESEQNIETESEVSETDFDIFETESDIPEADSEAPASESDISESEINNVMTPVIINGTEKELAVLHLINQARQQNGLASLTWDNALYETAKIRAEEASQLWSHTRPDGSHWSSLSIDLHGENLAKHYFEPQQVFDAWMASPGHKENNLRPEFTRAALYFYEVENGCYWCLHFGY